MSALRQQNINLEICDTIFKLLGITDGGDVSRFVLTVDFNEAPKIEITRIPMNVHKGEVGENTTQRFRIEPMESEPTTRIQCEKRQQSDLSKRLGLLIKTPGKHIVLDRAMSDNWPKIGESVASLSPPDPALMTQREYREASGEKIEPAAQKEPYIGLDGGVK